MNLELKMFNKSEFWTKCVLLYPVLDPVILQIEVTLEIYFRFMETVEDFTVNNLISFTFLEAYVMHNSLHKHSQ